VDVKDDLDRLASMFRTSSSAAPDWEYYQPPESDTELVKGRFPGDWDVRIEHHPFLHMGWRVVVRIWLDPLGEGKWREPYHIASEPSSKSFRSRQRALNYYGRVMGARARLAAERSLNEYEDSLVRQVV